MLEELTSTIPYTLSVVNSVARRITANGGACARAVVHYPLHARPSVYLWIAIAPCTLLNRVLTIATLEVGAALAAVRDLAPFSTAR
jgi:hypothetical protein